MKSVNLRLLIVEDSKDDAELLVKELKLGGLNVHWNRVESELDLKQALENYEWDLVVSDFTLNGFTGLDALRLVNESELNIPFVIVSGTIGEEIAVESMKNGVVDYFMKNNLSRLVPSIKKIFEDERQRKKAETEKLKREKMLKDEHRQGLVYQSMLLSSQLNPHFIFNSLNSIQYYILGSAKEPALEYLSKFAELMRTVLQNSMKKRISLENEIDFLKMYLNLEKMRLSDSFTFEIKVSANADLETEIIPPMLLQPYVENSVIHGLNELNHHGKLTIEFTMSSKKLVCKINDNGLGREESEKRKILSGQLSHKSYSMTINKNRMDLLNEIYGIGFKCEVSDLMNDENICAGTEVCIIIPVAKA